MKRKLFAVILLVLLAVTSSSAWEAWNIDEMAHPSLREYLKAKPGRVITSDSLADLRKALTIPPEKLPVNERVEIQNVNIKPGLRVRVYTPKAKREVYPALLWIHGGGHIMGTPEGNETLSLRIADELGCIVAAPAYRLTPEHPYPADVDDCYDTLLWMTENLPVDKSRVAVAGQSAGGGIAAAIALMARDRKGPELCFQMLMYPMIDYRNVTPSTYQITDHRAWCRDFNIFSWELYLANVSNDVPVYASPSLAEDLSGLPPAYVMVCGLDPFRDEDIAYAQRMMQAGVPVELHVYPGGTHGFEEIFPDAAVSVKAVNDYVSALAEALKAYNVQE